MGIIRTGVGLSLVAAPGWAGRIWVGDDADGGGSKVFARALGARDVVLGYAILAASGPDPATAGRLVKHGVLIDVADVVATLIAYRHLEGHRRLVMPLVAAGVGALGALVWLLGDELQEDPEEGAEPSVSAAEVAGIVDQQDAVLAEQG